jgi:hypothetical protein
MKLARHYGEIVPRSGGSQGFGGDGSRAGLREDPPPWQVLITAFRPDRTGAEQDARGSMVPARSLARPPCPSPGFAMSGASPMGAASPREP